MLCNTCLLAVQELKGVLIRDEERILSFHHTSTAHLKASAESGCRFCYTFWDQYSESERKFLEDSDSSCPDPQNGLPDVNDESDDGYKWRGLWMWKALTLVQIQPAESLLGQGSRGRYMVSIILNEKRGLVHDRERRDMGMFVLQPIDEAVDELASTQSMQFDPSTASPQAWSVANKWIEDCLSTHKTCNQRKGGHWYPTRLLDIRNAERNLRLTETTYENCSGSYATLSHRWGQAKNYTLRRSTYDQLRHGILISQLPLAFQDAIIICQRLDMRYLWIDSLCIMQDEDDLSDWLKEATLMHKVYSNSHLNISALAATDSSHSFFTLRETHYLTESYIETAIEGLHIGSQMKRYRIVDLLFWDHEIGRAPLNLRAWVLQERLLAPRVLHFGHHQLLWECHELDAAESYPYGLPALMSLIANTKFKCLDSKLYKDRMLHLHGDDPPDMAPYRLWARIVDSYTKCGVTKGEDKLIAIAGIAKEMRRLIDDDYICGMWRRYLASELTWHSDDSTPSQRSAQYRAPSFSWASIDGAVSSGSLDGSEILIRVVEVNLEFTTDDRTGLVRGGSLLLQGQIQKLFMKERTFVIDGKEIQQLDLNTTFYLVLVNDVEARSQTGDEWHRMGPVIALDEDEQYFSPMDRDDLYCVPVQLRESWSWLDVLLLQLVEAATATYRRFGLAMAGKKDDIDVFRRPAGSDEIIPSLGIEDGRHTIRLI